MAHPVRFFALAVLLIGVLGAVGFVHGVWTDRWPNSEESLLKDVEKVPLTIGVWECKSTEKVDKRLQDQFDGFSRRYVNQTNAETLSVMFSRGRPGPMVIKHLPTECYPSNGYEFEAQPKRFLVDRSDAGPADEFWVATFTKSNEATPQRIRLYWSWSGDGQWQIPDRPRLAFAGHQVLYKIYIVRTLLADDRDTDGPAVREFIKNLTQQMRTSFFAPAAG